MSFSVLSVTILLIFAVIAVKQILGAKERGLKKTIMYFANVVVSIVIAVILSPSVSRILVDRLHPIISDMDFYASLNTSATMDAFLKAFVSIILSSLLYFLLFCIIRGVISILFALAIPQRDPSSPEYEGGHENWVQRNSKSLTIILGAANAVIITMAFTAPIMGTLYVTDQTLDVISQITEEQVLDEPEEKLLKEFRNDVPGNLFYQFGGKGMYSAAASTDLYGKRVYLVNEVDTLERTALILLDVLPSLEDMSKFSEEESRKIDEICKNVQKIKLTGGFLADMMAEWSTSWLNGRDYMGARMPKLSNSLTPVFYEMLVVCSETDVYSAKVNTVTLLKVLAIIAKSGMLNVEGGDMISLMNLLSEGKVLDEIDEELAKNPNMYMVRKKLPTIVLGEISQEINNDKYSSEKYTVLLNQIAESLSEVQQQGGTIEQQIANLAGYTKQHLQDFGLEITDYIADIAAESLLTELVVLNGEASASDIDEFFDSFMDMHF